FNHIIHVSIDTTQCHCDRKYPLLCNNKRILQQIRTPGVEWSFPTLTNDVEHRLLPPMIIKGRIINGPVLCPITVLESIHCNLFNQSEYSDIELIVESEHFYAHRIILAARSEYFRALLYGGLRESQCDNHAIEIKECKSAAFKILLQYIYTGRINLLKEKEDILLDLLG
ncbi:unnamed protein product, partial [Rotaria sp. Silwood2]